MRVRHSAGVKTNPAKIVQHCGAKKELVRAVGRVERRTNMTAAPDGSPEQHSALASITRQRSSILKEIIASEETYLQDLRTLLKFYKDPLTFKAKQFISNSVVQNFDHPTTEFKLIPQLSLQDVNCLFSNVDAIVCCFKHM